MGVGVGEGDGIVGGFGERISKYWKEGKKKENK